MSPTTTKLTLLIIHQNALASASLRPVHAFGHSTGLRRRRRVPTAPLAPVTPTPRSLPG